MQHEGEATKQLDEQGELEATRAQLLGEVSELLRDHLAGDHWGRALVSLAQRGGEWVVADIEVEELFGDEMAVERAMQPSLVGPILPLIAQAIDILCQTHEVDVIDVEGGTFIKAGEGFRFLPGLIKTPSAGFEAMREAASKATWAKQEALVAMGVGERFDVDVEKGELKFTTSSGTLSSRAVLLGTFAQGACTWVWAWANPSLSPAEQRAAAGLCDRVRRRDLWEISTPQFFSDPGTAWQLCSIVCEEAAGAGLYRAPYRGGYVFFMLLDVPR